MKIIVDSREHKLLQELQNISFNDYESKSLDIGDIHICDDSLNILMIIERKTIPDLLSSIKDGRYSEQSLRLSSCDLHNHYIYYLIEGPITKPNDNLVISTMCSLSYFKGFSSIRTNNIKDTAKILTQFVAKLKKDIAAQRSPYYLENIASSDPIDYCSNIKTSKKENITPENILHIILKQIPSVSDKTAKTIHNKYHTLKNLLDNMMTNDTCLNDLKIDNEKTGKSRKINKTAIQNIFKFLLC